MNPWTFDTTLGPGSVKFFLPASCAVTNIHKLVKIVLVMLQAECLNITSFLHTPIFPAFIAVSCRYLHFFLPFFHPPPFPVNKFLLFIFWGRAEVISS